MRENYKNETIYEFYSLESYLNDFYGIGKTLPILLERRYENFKYDSLEDVGNISTKLKNYLVNEAPEFSDFVAINKIGICKLDALTSFRGWRHWKGFPTRGQGTWCNSWTAFRLNNFLREFKMFYAKKYYGNLAEYDLKLLLAAEETNLLWWRQWRDLCLKVVSFRKEKKKKKRKRRGRRRRKSRIKTFRVNLNALANGQIFYPAIEKKLTKKQEARYDESFYSFGFKPRFTKKILKGMMQFRKSDVKTSLFAVQKYKAKKKKVVVSLKLKIKRHKLKKKSKKTAWQ